MKRIVTVQDISCVGRCSLTVALPIISAAGVECGVLPTSVLSTHTAFSGFTFRDLTDELEPIARKWQELDIDFDAIYTGYLGSSRQISIVEGLFRDFKGDNTVIVIDPAMADNGKLYKGFSEDFPAEMARLCSYADLIIPNLTEASLMLGVPYREDYDEAYIRDLLKRLTGLGVKRAALTGIGFTPDEIGVYYYDGVADSYYKYAGERLPVAYHGTGDIYASAAVGALMRGISYERALKIATDYTLECMKETARDEGRRFYGVNFESAIPYYIRLIEAELAAL